MCRIFGQFALDVTPHEMRLAGAAQRHGGPDAQVVTSGRGWSLGSNRLAIMDPGHGRQPYRLGDVTVVFNGEIYNHRQLRADLRGRGYRFDDECDGSIIPALYLEFGPSFADRLDGMFAIAVVDLRDEPTLVLATDDIGMKSLYYQWDERSDRFHFASEIPGLLSFRGVGTDLWLPGLDEYLTTKVPFGERTMFAGIRQLSAGVTATLTRRRGLTITRRTRTPERIDLEPRDIATTVHNRLAAAVESLTAADVPVCAITSGGLDSSYVTALASRVVPDLHTFNIAYLGEWPGDERHFAREVAARAGTTHHQVEIDPASFPSMIPDVVWHLGQPNADPITLSSHALFAAVRDAGFKVALTGDASDELFGGYDRLRTAMSATGDWRTPYLESLAAVRTADRWALYSDDYRAYLSSRTSYLQRLEDVLHADRPRLDVLTEVEIGHRLPAYHLRRVDHMSMANSVEARLPFCQRAVVDLAAVLPAAAKINENGGKQALYAAAHGSVPESVLTRAKQPFTLPVNAMLRTGSPLLEYARDMLHADRIARRGLLDPAAVQRLLARQCAQPNDASALAVWSLMIFETWAEQFQVGSHALNRPNHSLLEVQS